jgi:2-methylisocitrate lyase-like PEP mutase family enzyme
METQVDKAVQFRQLHRGPHILVLPNVWDVASARIFEEVGFPAIATTSAGVAFSLGYPDGQRISREEMVARVARIVRAVKGPVTADVEAGYGSTPEDAARTTRELIQAGAVGMNLEDTDRKSVV